MVYKFRNGLDPDYLRSMFMSMFMRDLEGKLAVPMPRTNYLKNSFSYSGAVL